MWLLTSHPEPNRTVVEIWRLDVEPSVPKSIFLTRIGMPVPVFDVSVRGNLVAILGQSPKNRPLALVVDWVQSQNPNSTFAAVALSLFKKYVSIR